MADFFVGGTDLGGTSSSFAMPSDRAGERSNSLKYFEPTDIAMPPRAGMRSEALARSQTALDYKAARLEGGRTFLMDDYDAIGRTSRRPAPMPDSVASLIAYQSAPEPFSEGKGLASTKFGAGFTRRQQHDIKQDEARRRFEAERSER